MVYRIAIFLILFFSNTWAQEIKVSNVGIRDFSQFMLKDFTFIGELENLFILEDLDQLSYIYYKGFYKEMNINKQREVISSIKDRKLREVVELDFFKNMKKGQKNIDIAEIFNNMAIDEKIKLLLSIEFRFYDIRFENPLYNVYLKSYQYYESGQVNEAIKNMEAYKLYFPYTYVFYLLANNEINKAKESMEEIQLDDI